MKLRLLGLGFVFSILAAPAWSADPAAGAKCTRQDAGTFWPAEANRDPGVMRRAERCGTLLYCSRSTFGWKWQSVTVLAKANPGCATGGVPEIEKSNTVGKSDTSQTSQQ